MTTNLKNIVLLFMMVALTALSTPGIAADITLPKQLSGGFTLTRDVEQYNSENLFELINGQAMFYISYGFARLDHAFYEKDGETYKVDIYQIADNLSAMGCFREQMDIGVEPYPAGTEGYILDYLSAFYKGIYYVEIVPNADGVRTDIAGLAEAIADLLPGTTDLPTELSWFPKESLVSNSETYFGESMLSYSFMGRGLSAEYELPGSDKALKIFVSITDTPDSAAAVQKEFASKLTDAESVEGEQAGTGIQGELPYRGTSMIFTIGRYAIGCIGATDAIAAVSLLNELAGNLK